MQQIPKWLEWAKELQAIAQTGLTYSKDRFDIERFERIREMSIEITAEYTDLPTEKLKDLFASEDGYQTPKVDVRVAVFAEDKILMVKERSDGNWTLPGGWADIDKSISETAEIEVLQEATVVAQAERIVAILDRSRHDHPLTPYSIYKVFVQAACNDVREFNANSETLERNFFAHDALPDLSVERVNSAQIAMCFEAYKKNNHECIFD